MRVFFQRGQFTPEMGALVTGAVVGLTPSVLFVGLNQLLTNAFYAMDKIKVPALSGVTDEEEEEG